MLLGVLFMFVSFGYVGNELKITQYYYIAESHTHKHNDNTKQDIPCKTFDKFHFI